MAERMLVFFDVDERVSEVSAMGEDFERVKSLVDFEMFQEALKAPAQHADCNCDIPHPSVTSLW